MSTASPPTFRAKSVSTGVVVTTCTFPAAADPVVVAVERLALPVPPLSPPQPAATKASATRPAPTTTRMRLGTIPRIIPGGASGCDHGGRGGSRHHRRERSLAAPRHAAAGTGSGIGDAGPGALVPHLRPAGRHRRRG